MRSLKSNVGNANGKCFDCYKFSEQEILYLSLYSVNEFTIHIGGDATKNTETVFTKHLQNA